MLNCRPLVYQRAGPKSIWRHAMVTWMLSGRRTRWVVSFVWASTQFSFHSSSDLSNCVYSGGGASSIKKTWPSQLDDWALLGSRRCRQIQSPTEWCRFCCFCTARFVFGEIEVGKQDQNCGPPASLVPLVQWRGGVLA